MDRIVAVLVSVLPLLACAAPAASIRASEPAPACTVAPAVPFAFVSEGGRAVIPVALAGEAPRLHVADLPEGFRATVAGGAVTVRVPYGVEGRHAIGLEVACAGGVARAVVPVRVRRIAWQALPAWRPGADGPATRERPVLAIDPADENRLLLAGGTPARDAWAYDLSRDTWSRLADVPAPAGVPTARPGAVVHDAAGDRFVAACGSAPAGAACAVAVHDPGTGAWTGVRAEPDPVHGAPAARQGFTHAWDPETRRLVILGGTAGTDTWALDLSAATPRWTRLAGPDALPAGVDGCGVLDPEGHRLFVWAGDDVDGLWALELDRGAERWVRVTPEGTAPARTACAGVHDPLGKRVVFGFGADDGAALADLQALEL